MAGVKRRRTRSSAQAAERLQDLKRKDLSEDDEDILSDEAGSDIEDAPTPDASVHSDSDESVHENETAEEKRLRLARAYLRHVGISEDAAASDDEGIDSDAAAENDAANEQLRQQALKQTGKSTTYIADKVSASLEKATIVKCKGHALPPTCVALAAGEERVAISGGKDARLCVWDVETGKKLHMFKPNMQNSYKRNPSKSDAHIGNILTVAITDDASTAVSGGSDGLIRTWDLRSGKHIGSLRGHRGPIHGLSFRSGSKQLFSASKDRTVKIWDIQDMAYVETLFGHGGEVNDIASLAMERALSCGRDGTLRLYKVVEGSQLVFRSTLTMSIDVAAMINEHRFVSGGDDGTVCLWQANKKKPTAAIKKAHGTALGCESWISSVAAFPYTDLAISGGGDGILRFWKCEDVPRMHAAGSLNLGPGFVNGIAVGSRHGIIATAVGNEHRLGRWSRVRGVRNTIQFISLPKIEE